MKNINEDPFILKNTVSSFHADNFPFRCRYSSRRNYVKSAQFLELFDSFCSSVWYYSLFNVDYELVPISMTFQMQTQTVKIIRVKRATVTIDLS